MGELYRLTFPNGMSYIGITTGTAETRFSVHFYQRRVRKSPLSSAIKKYGRDDVVVETLAVAEWNELGDMERDAIARYGTKWPAGYNLTDGGEVPTGLTELSLAKMSAVHKGNTYRKGIPFTEEVKAAMSERRRGRPVHTAESRAAIGAAARGNKYSAGIRQSPETKAKKLSAMLTGPAGKASTSGHKGVSWCARTGRWRAHITVGRRMKDLGRHARLSDAIAARKRAEIAVLEGVTA
jgi:hypothetical protein